MIFTNIMRANILLFLGKHPGAVPKEMAAGCELKKNTVYYHLRILAQDEYVSRVEVENKLDYWFFLTNKGREFVRSIGGKLVNDCEL